MLFSDLNIVLDLITAVACRLPRLSIYTWWWIYNNVLFGGGKMEMNQRVHKWWGLSFVGKAKTKRRVIVQYEVDAEVYKKRLVVPLHIRDDETVPGGFNLLYITERRPEHLATAQIYLRCK